MDSGQGLSNLDQLVSGGYLKKVPIDPWGNEYRVKQSYNIYQVYSLGSDGAEDGAGCAHDFGSNGIDLDILELQSCESNSRFYYNFASYVVVFFLGLVIQIIARKIYRISTKKIS